MLPQNNLYRFGKYYDMTFHIQSKPNIALGRDKIVIYNLINSPYTNLLETAYNYESNKKD